MKPIKEKKEKTKKKQIKINRTAINIIRTTQRNNIDLKSIADNKANILLSVNSLMVTLLIPIFITNVDYIFEHKLYIPIGLLSITCLVTLILAALVLLPFSQQGQYFQGKNHFSEISPFFFQHFEKMSVEEYYSYFLQTMDDQEQFYKCILEDLHYFGRVITLKYRQIKYAFIVFIAGISISTLATALVLFLF